MIICHKYKFIFLKTNKTAGTSIEIALSRICGSDDVITPISAEDEVLRQSLGARGPQHYFAPILDYSLGDWKRTICKGERKKRFYSHMSACEIKALLAPEIWCNYYKFCFERNPWDRLISLYYWRNRRKVVMPSLSDYIDSGEMNRMKKRGREVYTIDGVPIVDRLCRYERLDEELDEVRRHLGIPESLELPRAKSSLRKDRRNFREILSADDAEKIRRMFWEEIDELGYTFH